VALKVCSFAGKLTIESVNVRTNISLFPKILIPFLIRTKFLDSLASLNSLALEIPHSCGISNNLPWGGYGQFF